jgi:hypothetical protein
MGVADSTTRAAAAGAPTPSWPLGGRSLSSPWRLLAAVGAIGEAVAHVPVTEEHLTEAPYIGVGFVLLVVAGLMLGILLLTAETHRQSGWPRAWWPRWR